MRTAISDTLRLIALAAGYGLFVATSSCLADDRAASSESRETANDGPPVSLLDAMRHGDVSVDAEGIGDGRMSLSLTNRTTKRLRVVLPPGLIASGATGQFGGMGGMGGGMMGGTGGGMMGGMGGMGGNRGGGFRSVAPTSLPEATLKPHQTRHLPTALVSLSVSNDQAEALLPAKGERLRIGEISQITTDARATAALKRLAADKAPQTVAQLVMWNVAGRLDWESIAARSQDWANPRELALAQQFVTMLDSSKGELPATESGVIYWDLKLQEPGQESLSAELRTLLNKHLVLGLKAQEGVPVEPKGPALACRIELGQSGLKVAVASSGGKDGSWVQLGSFGSKLDKVPPENDKSSVELRAARLADTVAEGVLSKIVRAQLAKGPRVNGKATYKVRLTNASPMILNGMALAGPELSEKNPPALLDGLSLPPGKSFNFPASAESVERLHLKEGVRVVAADLSAL